MTLEDAQKQPHLHEIVHHFQPLSGNESDDSTVPYDSDHEDLTVFDDDKNWTLLTDDHRYMANTGSFTMVKDNFDNPLDIYSVSSPQPVLKDIFHRDSKTWKIPSSKNGT